MKAKYFTILWWFLPYIDMNQPQVHMCPPHPELPYHIHTHPIPLVGQEHHLTNSWEKKRRWRQRRKARYTHLNAEFQRIARRDKKAFLSDQCKEIQENNRMGKTSDLFKKIRDTKGTCHAKKGTIKDSNGMT